jgi:hypothetical protein
MKHFKRFLSGIVAMTMVLASAVTVSADGTTTQQNNATEGSGAAEGYVNKDIRDVVVPTNALDFIVDPQGLISSSGSAGTKYKSITFSDTDKEGQTATDGFVYFPKVTTTVVSGKTTTKTERVRYIELVVENKSSYNVSVKPTIKYADGKVGKNAMGCTATINKSSTAALKTNLLFNLYQKTPAAAVTNEDGTVTPGEGYDYTLTTTKDKKGNVVAIANTLNGVPDLYKTTYDATNGYAYVLDASKYTKLTDADKATRGNVITYTLEGFSNTESTNWNTVVANMNKPSNEQTTVVQPKLTITWNIEDKK